MPQLALSQPACNVETTFHMHDTAVLKPKANTRGTLFICLFRVTASVTFIVSVTVNVSVTINVIVRVRVGLVVGVKVRTGGLNGTHLVNVVLVHPPERQPRNKSIPRTIKRFRNVETVRRRSQTGRLASPPPSPVRCNFAPISLWLPNFLESFVIGLVESPFAVSEPCERRRAGFQLRYGSVYKSRVGSGREREWGGGAMQ